MDRMTGILIALVAVAVVLSGVAVGVAVSNGNDDSSVTVFDWKVNSVTEHRPGYYVASVVVSCAGTGGVHVYYDNGMDIGSFTANAGKHTYSIMLHRSDNGTIVKDGIIGVK